MEEFEKQERISDEDFINSYTKRTKHRSRTNKYSKENDKKSSSNIMFYFFLGISFIIAYYMFSTYFFIPKV